MKTIYTCLCLIVIAILSPDTLVPAQGTAKDYQRSAEIGKRFRDSYRPQTPKIRWHERGIVVENKTTDGASPIHFFDGKTGKKTEASSLEDLELEFESTLLHPRKNWRRSKRTDSTSEITFENTFDQPVRLFWSGFNSRLQSFGQIPPGEKRTISTFDGHQWVVDFRRNDLAGIFEANGSTCTAQINEKSRQIAMNSLDGGTSRDTSRPNGELTIRQYNVWLTAHDDSKQLTTDGTEDDRYVRPFQYSPDGRYAIGFQSTQVKTRQIPLIDSSPDNQIQPEIQWINYAKPGDPLPQRRPKLFDLKMARQIDVDEQSFDNSWSVEFKGWSNDGKSAYVLYNRRGHQQISLKSIRLADGKLTDIVNETSETFVDYSQKLQFNTLKNNDEFLWASERDGWNHLYRIDAKTGTVINQVTKGDWLVREIDMIDNENQVIWFTAMGIHPNQDPYHRHLAKVNFDGSGLTILTKSDGDHRWQFSPDRKLLLAKWSRADHPETWELRSANDGKLIAQLFAQDISDLEAAGFETPIRFAAPGRDEKTMIYGQIIRPSNFDPQKSYPVIENIYAGPHGYHVPKTFGLQISLRRIAELGFVIVQIDGMGTNWRSRSFHDVCFQNLADSGFPDRIAWLKSAARKYPWINLSQVGVFGGSAGGQNALAALLHHGDFYKAAASDCGCHDNRMDKIWWNEAWMGEMGPHYESNSNVTHAHKLQGKLLLTVGELDRNVDPTSTLQVVDALIRADKDFEMVIVPGAGHGVGESRYLFRRRMDFFVRSLMGVEPRE